MSENISNSNSNLAETVKKITDEARRLAAENPDKRYRKPSYESLDPQWYWDNSEAEFTDEGELAHVSDCLYIHKTVDDPAPVGGCLFGQALLNVGFTPEQIKPFEGCRIREAALGLLGLPDDGTLPDEAENLLKWANGVQGNQDMGDCWGDAVGNLDEDEDQDQGEG